MMDGDGGFIQGDTALAALRSICDGFIDSSSWLDRCEVVSPDALPGNIRRLLAHEQHMTPTLRDHSAENSVSKCSIIDKTRTNMPAKSCFGTTAPALAGTGSSNSVSYEWTYPA
jgi:hypothetical protein